MPPAGRRPRETWMGRNGSPSVRPQPVLRWPRAGNLKAGPTPWGDVSPQTSGVSGGGFEVVDVVNSYVSAAGIKISTSADRVTGRTIRGPILLTGICQGQLSLRISGHANGETG